MDLSRSPLHVLHRAVQRATDVFDAEMQIAEIDLTVRQLVIMIAIATHEGGNQRSLVEATGIDRSTTTDIVTRLVRKGWVQRRRTKGNLRSYRVGLTQQGRRTLEIAVSRMQGVDEHVLASLSAERRRTLIDDLNAIVRHLGAPPPGGLAQD